MDLTKGKQISETRIMTPEARLSFPHLFKVHASLPNQEEKFSCSLLFDKKADLSLLRKLAQNAIAKKWGEKPDKLKSPFLDGNEYEYDGYQDKVLIRLRGGKRPGVVDQQRTPVTDESEIYPGCYCVAIVNAFTWEKPTGKGVSFGLLHIQKSREGEMFGDASKAEEDFEVLENNDTNSNTDVNSEDAFGI